MQSTSQIASPCVSNCCLDDKDMCLGCFRMMSEILVWSESNDQKKQTILDACKQRQVDYKAQHKNYFSP